MESTTYDPSAAKQATAPKIGFVSLGCPKDTRVIPAGT